MTNRCAMCGNEGIKKIKINIKEENGYKPIDSIWLCENCLNICYNSSNIVLGLLAEKGKITIKEWEVNGSATKV